MKHKHPGSPIATPAFDDTGPSSSNTPYVVPTHDGVQFVSLLTTGDQVGLQADGVTPWRMAGIPDGLGAFDNGDGHHDGTHEPRARRRERRGARAWLDRRLREQAHHRQGYARGRARRGFVEGRLSLRSRHDSYVETTTQFARLCSADLPAVSAFYDSASGLGTTERIFLDGEEIGNEGRAFAHIVTGSEAGDSYELPALGRFSWENAVANPASGAKTVVVGTDDFDAGRGLRLRRRQEIHGHGGREGRPHRRQPLRHSGVIRR